MARGIDDIRPGAEHRDGRCARVERGRVRGGVDAFGETARDRESGRNERTRETARIGNAAVTRAAAADDRDLRLPECAGIAGDEQGRGRAGRIAQQRRIVGVVDREELMRVAVEPGEIVGDACAIRRAAQPLAARRASSGASPRRAGIERLSRAAVAGDCIAQCRGAETRCAQQDQPRFDVGAIRFGVHRHRV